MTDSGDSQTTISTDGGTFIGGNVTTSGSSKVVGGDDNSINIINEAPPPIVPALHQLPAPPADFVGREAELTAILNDLQRGAVITGIRGLGGIGKTALALVIADRVKQDYRDAQFFINLRGASDRPMSPAEALTHVIRAYYPNAQLPEAVAELERLYCSVLDGQRAMIVLDDARDAAQIKSLLPPASCLLLITSRQHFTLPGLHATDLNTLSPDDARKLLLEIAPHLKRVILSAEGAKNLFAHQPEILRSLALAQNDTAAGNGTVQVVDVIAYFCGCLPQALRAAGSLLANVADLDPADYAVQLRDERTRLEQIGVDPAIGVNVEASLNLSAALLSPEARGVFARLSVFPASFDAAAEEVICADDGHRHLSTLLQLSLVQYDPATRRYTLHDLVRLFAAARLSPDYLTPNPSPTGEGSAPSPSPKGEGRGEGESYLTPRRHAEHYLNVLWQIDELYKQGGDNILRGLALFDTEWPNIQAGQAWAANSVGADPLGQTHVSAPWANTQVRPDNDAAQLCNDYPNAGTYVLDLRLHQRENIRWLEAALKAARQLKRRDYEGVHLGNLGYAYAALGETRKAIAYYNQALPIFREISDRRAEGNTFGSLGVAYRDLGETRKAIECHEQHLVIAREIGDLRGEANALMSAGNAHNTLGEYRHAIEYHNQALPIFCEIGDRRGEGSTLSSLGLAYADLGETRKAIKCHEQHLVIALEIGDLRGKGAALSNLGLTYASLGETRKAIEYYEQSLPIFREISDRRGEGTVLRNMALAWNKLGEHEQASAHAIAALMVLKQIEDPGAEKVLQSLAERENSGQKKKWWQVWKQGK